MTTEERIRQLIFDVEDWRDELASVTKMLESPDLSREQRLTLVGDQTVLRARIHRAEVDLSNYAAFGLKPREHP